MGEEDFAYEFYQQTGEDILDGALEEELGPVEDIEEEMDVYLEEDYEADYEEDYREDYDEDFLVEDDILNLEEASSIATNVPIETVKSTPKKSKWWLWAFITGFFEP